MPLKLLLETSEKGKIVPVHKKEEKDLLKNYRPISLLPISSKIFEKVIYNFLLNHFVSERLFTPSHSEFLLINLCIALLVSIIYAIQTNFDRNSPVDLRGVFFDLSNGFDKVLLKGFYTH